MKKILLSILIVISILSSQMLVFASFDDINGEDLSWAKTAIDEMTESGVIYGYGDGTFRPNNEVSKQEALVLIARIIGINDKTSLDFVELASDTYAEALSGYKIPYKDDVAYLLYRGILTPEDLSVFASDEQADKPLKRYEAAILLTKIIENNIDNLSKDFTLEFDDADEIPNDAKPYVNYVCEKEIMYGTSDTKFSPNNNLSRAMIATLLYRIIPIINYSFDEGELLKINPERRAIRISCEGDETSTFLLPEDAIIVLDGIRTDLSNFKPGAKIRITHSNNNIIFIEGVSENYKTVVSGMFESYEEYEDSATISVKDEIDGEIKTYMLSSNATFSKDGELISAENITKENYISLSIKGGKVYSTEVFEISDEKSYSGVITQILISANPSITIKFNDDTSSDFYITDDTVIKSLLGNSIYDLRLNDQVNFIYKDHLITEISVIDSNLYKNISGIVENVQSEQGYIKISNCDELILISKATIQNISATLLTSDDIKKDSYVTVFGETINGAFEAKLIIVTE